MHQFIIESAISIPFNMKLVGFFHWEMEFFLHAGKNDEQQNFRFEKEKMFIPVHINTWLPVMIRFRVLS